MSFQDMARAVKAKGLSSTEKFVFLMICNYTDHDGYCYPSINRLADDCELNERTVRRSINALCEKGLLEKENRSNNGLKTTNLYRVTPIKVGQDTQPVRTGTESGSDRAQSPVRTGTVPDKPISNNLSIESKKTKAKKDPDFSCPEGIRSESWEGFLEMRKQIKKPLTPHGVKLLISKLSKINQETGQDPSEVLDQSTMNSWQGVFPLKENKYDGVSKAGSFRDALNEMRGCGDSNPDVYEINPTERKNYGVN